MIEKAGEEVAPAGTVTDDGGVTFGSLLLRATTMPPSGAEPFNVTLLFPATVVPPTTDIGERVKALSWTDVTVSVAVLVTPL